MSLDVALATSRDYPDLDDDSVPLLEALRALGLRAEPRVWDSGFDAAGARLCLIRSTWDYDSRRDEFVAWARATAARTDFAPAAAVVEWNSDKRYLRELEARGVPVVPTAWLATWDSPADVMGARGWERVVMKPAVAAGSRGLRRLARAEAHDAQPAADALLARGPVLLQPYLPSVESDGELSLIFGEGELTHAVRKRPRSGDFRVQPEWGGSFTREEPGDAEIEVARLALGALDHTPLVARVDLVSAPGGPVLMELELIEPRLYLSAAPEAAARLADAVARRLGGAT